MKPMFVIHKESRIPLIMINSIQQIKVVDCDEEDVAGPDGRYSTVRDEKKD